MSHAGLLSSFLLGRTTVPDNGLEMSFFLLPLCLLRASVAPAVAEPVAPLAPRTSISGDHGLSANRQATFPYVFNSHHLALVSILRLPKCTSSQFCS